MIKKNEKYNIFNEENLQYIASAMQNNIVNNFIILRKQKKISRKELANKSGVSYASIRRFEEMGEISLNSLLKLAESLNALSEFGNLFSENIPDDLSKI